MKKTIELFILPKTSYKECLDIIEYVTSLDFIDGNTELILTKEDFSKPLFIKDYYFLEKIFYEQNIFITELN